MKKAIKDRKTVIEPAHAKGIGALHDREQLRKRLLRLIVKSEADRRGHEIKPNRSASAAVDLVVFDPEDLIGRERVAESTPPKRA